VTGATTARAGPDHRAAVRAATFADVLRSEWTKFRSVRPAFWALAVTVVPGIALGAVISAAAARGYARSSVSGKLSWDPAGVSLAGMAIAQLAIAVLGVLAISSEYSSGMIRTSLIAVPKRGRGTGRQVAGRRRGDLRRGPGHQRHGVLHRPGPHRRPCPPRAAPGDPGVARAVAGAGLYLTALAVLSVAAGTLLRHPAAAIAGLIAVLLVLPAIAQAPPDSWRNPVTEFWPAQAGGQLTSVHHSAHTLQPWPGLRRDVPVHRHRARHRLDAAGPPGRMTAARARRHTHDPAPRCRQ
jgi:ABC-2 type transport system permease protein